MIAARRSVVVAVIAAVMLGVMALFYLLDPEQSQLMPKCAFKLLTGLDCPSCGSQRALHALLHGRMADALSFNPFLVLSIPYLIAVMWGYAKAIPGSDVVRRIAHHPIAMLTYVALFCIWWIARNLLF